MSGETYGQRVTRLRGERGWTQDDLAERSGVPKRTIQDVELDKRKSPQRNTRLRLNAALDIAGDPNDERQSWPNDVQVFLDIMGAWLTTLDEETRLARISQLVRDVVSNNNNEH